MKDDARLLAPCDGFLPGKWASPAPRRPTDGGPGLGTPCEELKNQRARSDRKHPRHLALPPKAHEARTVSLRSTRGDSDLEAFSRNPTDGSFAPLASRPSTCTKCPNLR